MSDKGKLIHELRIKAGFTQKTLAEALHVTDKAISKWERGICLPDTSLLPRLALLLDVDLDLLLSGDYERSEWAGLIDVGQCDLSRQIYDKPLVYYILVHYLLLGITRIHVLTDEKNEAYLSEERFSSLGFRISFDLPQNKNVMMIRHPWFLFGSDLTQQFQGAMLSNRLLKVAPENHEAVFYFVPKREERMLRDYDALDRKAKARALGRGMVVFGMDNDDDILDAALFVRAYQKSSGMRIAGLEEIRPAPKPQVD